MASFSEFFREHFGRVQPLAPEMHHYQSAPDESPYRLHLRLEKDGSGILIVNAATVLHLNPTAAEYALHLVRKTPPEQAVRQMVSRYRIDHATALKDFTSFSERIHALIDTPDLDPVTYLDFERVGPHSVELVAPLRLDCALTYRLPDGTSPGAAPTRRVDRELSAGEWQTVMDKAWAAGIPHLTFTGGEPTLRDDLPVLVAHAEKNGQVCGLLSDGLKLADRDYRQSLLQAGLDHLLFILQPSNPASWQALEVILPEDLFTTVHLTITPQELSAAAENLARLARLGARSLSLSYADAALRDTAQTLQNQAAALGLTLRWDLPVPYSLENPVAYETVDDQVPAGAGKAWLYVEPDGDVLPAQGLAGQVLGNFLKDPWERIRQG